MFLPNTSGMLSSRARATRDVFGQITYTDPVEVRCCIISLDTKTLKTPIRADASASRGASEDLVVVAKILFSPDTGIAQEDRFEIAGVMLRVIGIRPRNDIFGTPDHIEVDFGAWVR